MACNVTATGATLGAIVTGVRLGALDDAEWRAIEAAFHTHAVLIFPGQQLGHAEQVAFARRFGELDVLVAKTGRVAISNVLPGGRLRDDADPIKQILLGNEGWHTDSSYMPVSARASMLSAEVVTEQGGETEWADMRAAYEVARCRDPRARRRAVCLSLIEAFAGTRWLCGRVERLQLRRR
jgi:alpha-ketoglutarate-dependent taurine dioxygenase